MEILALIPARGGSKGIPNKNVRPFAGKPLIAHTVDAAKAAPSVGRIVVTTDSSEIAEAAKAAGAEVPVLRPAEMAGDKAPVMAAIIHMLDHLRDAEGYAPTHVLLLQTTSPLRTAADIEGAVARYRETGADALVSLCRTENGLYAMDAGHAVETLYEGYGTSTNRQLLPACYKLDGCMLYLIRTDLLREARSFFAGKLVGYEIERWRAVDLDEPEDFAVGELVFRHAEEIRRAIAEIRKP